MKVDRPDVITIEPIERVGVEERVQGLVRSSADVLPVAFGIECVDGVGRELDVIIGLVPLDQDAVFADGCLQAGYRSRRSGVWGRERLGPSRFESLAVDLDEQHVGQERVGWGC